FGSGAAIFYNFVDLVLYNATAQTFQFRLHVGEHQLEGELLSDQERRYSYHIYEKAHAFIRKHTAVYRKNEIWRDIYTKYNVGAKPQCLASEQLYHNHVIVKYKVDDKKITA